LAWVVNRVRWEKLAIFPWQSMEFSWLLITAEFGGLSLLGWPWYLDESSHSAAIAPLGWIGKTHALDVTDVCACLASPLVSRWLFHLLLRHTVG
jgi:hypothetical protein